MNNLFAPLTADKREWEESLTEEERESKKEWEDSVLTTTDARLSVQKILDECFQIADADGDGLLNRAEFEIYLRRVGECAQEMDTPWRGRDD